MKTILIYFIFTALAFVFMSLSQQFIIFSNGECKIKFKKIYFLLSFFCLLFLLFNNIGADYESYIFLIKNTKEIHLTTVEPLFSALCFIFNFIFKNNYAATYFMLTVIGLVVFYISFFIIRKDVNLSYCIVAFILFAYFRLYLVAMHLASALILLSFVLLYKKLH